MPSKLKVQIRKISQSLHPNPLILGGLKEKAPIYNFTEQFFHFPFIRLKDLFSRVSLVLT